MIQQALILTALILFSANSWSNTPCSGKKGGIDHCNGSQFVCKDGSVSKSTKDCTAYMSGNAESDLRANLPNNSPPSQPTQIQPISDSKEAHKILKLDYDGFTVWLDCNRRGAVKFQYNAQHDTGNEKRAKDFILDPNVPVECQQISSKPYGQGYDRGHQVPANHLDYSANAIKQSNYMTNILPQTLQLNRGAWLESEMIVECYRDIDELLVIGGAIFGRNTNDDFFLQSHGVETPDLFWKVIIRGKGQDERAIAWIMPNIKEATRKNLDSYLVTVDEIERVTGEKIPVADYAKHDKPSQSWIIPKGCNRG